MAEADKEDLISHEEVLKEVRAKYNADYVFAPFNKRKYTLQVFNAIEYKGMHFVELYLVNKNLQTWVIGVKFNKDGEPIEHCISSIIY